MLTPSEQRELCQIEKDLRNADCGFAWRLAMVQGMLRWAVPGRRGYLLVLAVLAAALLRLIAVAGRLLRTLAEGAGATEPTAREALGDTGWPGWESGQASRHSASRAQDRPRPDETGLR